MLSYILSAKNRDTLTKLRSRLSDRGIQCSRMATLFGDKIDYRRWTLEQVEFWLSLQAIRRRPANVMGFSAWVGHGCEPLMFGLAETSEGLIYEGHCETYGDQTPSIEVFEHRHIQAIKMLEDAQSVGMKIDVLDYSGYWHSRDLNCLSEAVKSTNKLAALIEQAAKFEPDLLIAKGILGNQCNIIPA